jgi:hypothetical protein
VPHFNYNRSRVLANQFSVRLMLLRCWPFVNPVLARVSSVNVLSTLILSVVDISANVQPYLSARSLPSEGETTREPSSDLFPISTIGIVECLYSSYLNEFTKTEIDSYVFAYFFIFS